jgi:hypothetical protein
MTFLSVSVSPTISSFHIEAYEISLLPLRLFITPQCFRVGPVSYERDTCEYIFPELLVTCFIIYHLLSEY